MSPSENTPWKQDHGFTEKYCKNPIGEDRQREII